MRQHRLLAGVTVIFFIIGFGMLNSARAGEVHKAHATSVTTKLEQIEVGDEDGHVIILYQSKQIWTDDETGEQSVGTSTGIMDMNMKTGQGSVTGYNVRSYPNGEKWFTKSEGAPVGPGLMKGTFIYTGGTGQFEGLHGKGTWEAQTLEPGIAAMKAEGERELGGQ